MQLLSLLIWSPTYVPKWKTKTQQILLSCSTANAQAWLCAQKARNLIPLPPLSRRRPVPSQKGQDSRKSRWLFALYVYIHKGAWSIGKNVHIRGSELRVEAGVSAHLHQSVESTQKRPQCKNPPHPTSRTPCSFSQLVFSITSHFVCTYSSSLHQVLPKPIKWIRPL